MKISWPQERWRKCPFCDVILRYSCVATAFNRSCCKLACCRHWHKMRETRSRCGVRNARSSDRIDSALGSLLPS